jgi:hypothetical protein
MRKIFVLLFLLGPCASSYAALGAAQSTFSGVTPKVTAHVLASSTSTTTSSGSSYQISESTLTSGTVVREYVSASGVVFGVSWSGPFMPDLRTLLGSNFSTLTAAAAQKTKAGHSQLQIQQSDIVIVSGGHMRAYQGRAWIPSALPSGFSTSDIK